MATIILALLSATTTVIIYSLGYATAEYKHWLKNQKQNNEETSDKSE